MILEIDCTSNIIVGVIYNNEFNWYLSDKSLWYLDGIKLFDSIRRKGFDSSNHFEDEFRKGLDILDQNNAMVFLERINRFKISTSKLNELLLIETQSSNNDWIFNFRPSLFVNFDLRQFYSLYSEPASYEYYAPINWYSTYDDFTNLIPLDERYWLDVNNEDIL
ncbi:MAG: hypothetical protein ACRCTA_04250 [Bacilli bacterium]